MNNNIEQLVWDNTIPFVTRLEMLTNKRIELQSQITNRKKLSFNIYYKFPTNLDSLTINNQWKVLTLAVEVLKVTKRWDRKYKIDLKRKLSGEFFVNYFKDTIDTSKFNLCTIGINFYHRKGYTFKTFVLWANKLCKLGIMGDEKFNSFMKELELMSNGK